MGLSGPLLFEIIRQHLFPDSPARCLFRAARLDPRPNPAVALRAASTDLRELEQTLGPTLPGFDVFSPPPIVPGAIDVEALLETTIALPTPTVPILPSAVSGIFGLAAFSVPFLDPEVTFVAPVPPQKVAVYVYFRDEFVKTKIATFRQDTTGLDLLEMAWKSVAK